MTKQEEIIFNSGIKQGNTVAAEYHEHPFFNGQFRSAVWVQIWVSGGTNEFYAPDGAPITCAVCGR